MKVIERYILRRVFVVFIAALFWTLAIVWTTQVLARIDLVTDSGQTARTFFEIATLMLPSITPMVIPFALIIGIAQTLSTMNTDSELVVMSAAGTPRTSTIKPIMLLAVACSIASFAIDNGVEPYSRELTRQKLAAARADLISLIVQEGTFRKLEDGLYVQIGKRLPDGNLGQIFVADTRDKSLELAYYAKSGTIIEDGPKRLLMMFDGVINRKTAAGEVSVIRFQSYGFDMAEFTNAVGQITMYPKDRTLAYILNPPASDPMYQERPQMFRAEVHKRFTEWLYPIVFALIAIAVVGDARSYRESRIHPLVTAIILALFWRWVGFFTTDGMQSSSWFVGPGYAALAVPAAVSIFFIATNRSLELPISWVDRVVALARRVRRFFSQRWDRLLRRHRPVGSEA